MYEEYIKKYKNKLKEKKMGLFALAVKTQIVKMNSKQELEYKPLVDFYLNIIKKIRNTKNFL